MDTNLYKVTFNGELVDGKNIEEVKKSIALAFKTSAENIEKYFSKETLIIRNNIDYQTAIKIKEKMYFLGAICHIEVVTSNNSIEIITTADKKTQEAQIISTENKTKTISEQNTHNNTSIQQLILGGIAILVRATWSATIGLFFFSTGLALFLIVDILAPNSNYSYRILTNMYKWGSCHWFKRLRLETENYEIDVKKTNKTCTVQ